MKDLNNEISELPHEQLSWFLTIKNIFKPTIYNGTMDIKDLLNAIRNKASEKQYLKIVDLLDIYDLENYFKN
jgi:ADP-dependent phosphofructokinase/glucokinase